MSACERRHVHGAHAYIDGYGTDRRCPGTTIPRAGSPTPLRDRIYGPECPACGIRTHDGHACTPPAAAVRVTHARLLDGTVLCPSAEVDSATVFLDVVTCDLCAGRLARIQGRPLFGRRAKAGAA